MPSLSESWSRPSTVASSGFNSAKVKCAPQQVPRTQTDPGLTLYCSITASHEGCKHWQSERSRKQSHPWWDAVWYKWHKTTQRYSLRHQWRSQNVVLSEKRNTTQPVIKLWKSHSWWTHASVTHTGLLKVIYLSSTKEKPHKYIFQWGVCTFVCHILPPTIHTTPKILQ